MKLIGMLGGMSWESTAEYYRLANQLVRDRRGGLSSARVLLHSVDFAAIEKLQAEGDWDTAGKVLAEAARGLAAGGADFLILCTNTMHRVADAIEDAAPVPLLHIGDATADAVLSSGVTRVGLLGTRYTMEQAFLRDRLTTAGLDVLVPDAPARDEVHRTIYDELCLGVVRDESRLRYQDVIRQLVERGAQGVILGCTEIELLIRPQDSPVPTFPTTRLHVEAAVSRALA